MFKLILFVLPCLMVGGALAQSVLPVCQGNKSMWTNCLGSEKNSNGDKYVGEFKDGQRNGQGTLIFANGGKFVGEWLDGLRHGPGIEYGADDTIITSGRWDQGITAKERAIQWKTEIEKKLRQENLARIRGLVENNTRSTNAGPPSPLVFRNFSSSYVSLLIARIKPNLTYPESLSGNPRTEVEVNIDQEGNILNRRIVQSSGSKAWDDAVLSAIDRTAVIPKDIDGRVPNKLVIVFRPLD
jgi:TonB family protein